MGKAVDLTGEKFTRLLVIERDKTQKGKGRIWICKCDCDEIVKATSSALLNYKKSCGCLNTETRKKNALSMGKKNKTNLKKRFFKYVEKTDNCWNWIGGIEESGYGRLWYKGKTVKAHRLSYIKHKGKIPKGLLVCHTCDNPKCVNPDHLFLGTHQDNYDDMINKGRKVIGSVGKKKLNEDDVKKIIKLISLGKTIKYLQEMHNVSSCTIYRIKNGTGWKHIKRCM